jgi:hypothetical protein
MRSIGEQEYLKDLESYISRQVCWTHSMRLDRVERDPDTGVFYAWLAQGFGTWAVVEISLAIGNYVMRGDLDGVSKEAVAALVAQVMAVVRKLES